MDAILMWLAVGGGGLLTVAVAVAWWEHWQRSGPRGPRPEDIPPPRVIAVDLHVDELAQDAAAAGAVGGTGGGVGGTASDTPGPNGVTAAAGPDGPSDPASDSQARRAALDQALNRMTRPAPWLDTRPTVLTSTVPSLPPRGPGPLGPIEAPEAGAGPAHGPDASDERRGRVAGGDRRTHGAGSAGAASNVSVDPSALRR